MRSVNKATLLGNVGQDPEVRTTHSGTKVAKVSLATSKKFKNDRGELVERTAWHRLTFWGRSAEIVEEYVSKGTPLYVEGELEYDETDDPEYPGRRQFWTSINVREFSILPSGGAR